MNGLAIVKVQGFKKKGSEADSNGVENVILVPVAGKLPSRRIIAGTIALNAGFRISDERVLVSFTEGEEDPQYGRRFNFVPVGTLTTMEFLQAQTQLGEPLIINVEPKGEAATEAGLATASATPVVAEVTED
jgi:hypothetical protein